MKRYTWLLLPILFFGCKKDVIHVDPVTLKNFSFKPGSYWIYKDSLTGKEDSFRVHDNTTSTPSDNVEYNAAFITLYGETEENACSFHLHKTTVEFQFTTLSLGCGFSYPYTADVTILPTFSVNGITYDSVAIAPHATNTFYAKAGVGIVKMRVTKGSFVRVWELQRYKLQ